MSQEAVAAPQTAQSSARASAMETSSSAPKKKRSFAVNVLLFLFTFLCIVFGVGLLALPKIFSVCGYVMSAIFLVLSVICTIWGFRVLYTASYHGNFTSLRDMATKTWGRAFGMFVDVIQVISNIGYLCCYESITADYLREAIASLGHIDVLYTQLWQRVMKILVAIIIILPLTFLRSIYVLSYISTFSLLFVIVTLVAVTVRFAQYTITGVVNGVDAGPIEVPVFPSGSKGWLSTIAYFTSFLTPFVLHSNMVPMQREMEETRKDSKRIIKVSTLISVAVAVVVSTLIGVEGSLMFKRSCEEGDLNCQPINSNLLLSFKDDMLMCIIKLLYAVVVVLSFPCLLYPVRTSLCEWSKVDKFNGKRDPACSELSPEEFKKLPVTVRKGYLFYILFGFAVLIVVTIFAIFVPEIDLIITIFTNLFAFFIYQVLPLFIWFKMPIIAKLSIGKLLDEKLVEQEDEPSISANMHKSIFQDIAEQKRNSLMAFTEKTKYSYRFDGNDNTKVNNVLDKAKVQGGANENVQSSDDKNSGSEVIPSLLEHSSDSSESESKSSSSKSSSSSTKTDIIAELQKNFTLNNNNIVNDAIRQSIILANKTTSIVKGHNPNEGDIEVVFPDISKEPFQKRGWRFGIFVTMNVVFIGFNLSAFVCNILSL